MAQHDNPALFGTLHEAFGDTANVAAAYAMEARGAASRS